MTLHPSSNHDDSAETVDLDQRLRVLDAAWTPTPDSTLNAQLRRGITRHRRLRRRAASVGFIAFVSAVALALVVGPAAPRPEALPVNRVAQAGPAEQLSPPDTFVADEAIPAPRSLVLLELDLVRQRMATLAAATRSVVDQSLDPTS